MLSNSLKVNQFNTISDGRYEVKLAQSQKEIESALRLRFDVFNVEISHQKLIENVVKLEFDEYDFKCKHLIVVEKETQQTIGTYRLNSIETALTIHGFYSFNEFCLENLPFEILTSGIEIGRACIAPKHRHTRALFLLWKGLAHCLKIINKRYFFGCCSIFTTDKLIGEQAFRKLKDKDGFHKQIFIEPRHNSINISNNFLADNDIQLPNLFEMYLKIGAKFCSLPMIDYEFGTIDFFMIFDVINMQEKYRKMFFGEHF